MNSSHVSVLKKVRRWDKENQRRGPNLERVDKEGDIGAESKDEHEPDLIRDGRNLDGRKIKGGHRRSGSQR